MEAAGREHPLPPILPRGEKIDTQETAFEGAAKRRPVASPLSEASAERNRSHLGIQIVEVVQHQRLAEHGKFWRTKTRTCRDG